jgi:hypothetical protein
MQRPGDSVTHRHAAGVSAVWRWLATGAIPANASGVHGDDRQSPPRHGPQRPCGRRVAPASCRRPSRPQRTRPMTFHFELNALIALIAGILILIMPRLLNYVVALYLIIIGILGLVR